MLVPAAFVAHAVLAHASRARHPFEVVIVTDEGSVLPDEGQWLSRLGVGHKTVDFADLRKIFDTSGRLTTATLVKLVLPELFADRFDRILYLDTDLTIHADVTALFGLDFGEMPLAANPRGVIFLSDEQKRTAEAHFAELGMSRPFRYFNSGVMLINVASWRACDLTARTLDFITRNRELCLLPDEDGLNAVLRGRFAPLSPIWNMAPRRPPFLPLHRAHTPAIIHYSGHDKPWKRFGAHKPLFPDMQAFRLYEQFLPGSPWPNWLSEQWSQRDLLDALGSTLRSAVAQIRAEKPYGAAAYAKMFNAYVAKAEFLDVDQGLATRAGGRLGPCV